MRKLTHLFKKNEKGQSVVEFALVLPILLLLVFGIIQFGIIFNAYITITSAAREGARLAVVGGTDEQVRTRVRQAAVALLLEELKDEDIKIDPPFPNPIDNDNDERKFGEKLSVTVNGTIPVVVPGFNVFMGPAYTFSSESIMRVEKLPDPDSD